MSAPSREPGPILKWAGGKRQLLHQLRRFYPESVGAYFEPFLGSGAVFFDLWNQGLLADARVALTDQNADLIGCYLRVRDAVDDVVECLGRLTCDHARHGSEHYYRVRDAAFNPARAAWREAGGRAEAYTPELAAMLIYLNRTGYNGLFRQNAQGDFNVPIGRYDRPRIVNEPLLRAVSEVLATPRVQLAHTSFEQVLADARPGDFVYFDPPYAPLTQTARFRAYTAVGFDAADQERLQRVAIALAERGSDVLLSNSTAADVCRLYQTDPAATAAGLRAYRVPARRAINSRSDRRGAVEELLVSNRPSRPAPAPAARAGR